MDERTGIDMGASVAVLGPQIAGLPEVVDVTRLLAAEKAGKNRKRVLTCLEKRGRALWQLLASPKGAVDQHGQMVAALAWCQETGRSARKAANLGVEGGLVTKGEKALWPDIKPGTLQGWLKNPALAEGGGHERQKILLLSELTDIYEALVEGADRHKFKDRSQIRTMIKQALRLRQLQTKQKVRGHWTTPLRVRSLLRRLLLLPWRPTTPARRHGRWLWSASRWQRLCCLICLCSRRQRRCAVRRPHIGSRKPHLLWSSAMRHV